MEDINLKITNITDENAAEKLEQATEAIAKALKVPITIKPSLNDDAKEDFQYQAQEDWAKELEIDFAKILDSIYLTTCNYLDLPVVTTFSKAIGDDDPLIFKGKVIFNPETGQPLKKGIFQKLIDLIERFLNRKLLAHEKKITLGSSAIGRMISNMLKNNTKEAVEAARLSDLKPKRGYSFTDVNNSMQQYKEAFNVPEDDMNRLRMVQEKVGEHISGIQSDTLKQIRDIYTNGVLQRQSKSQIAQKLFDTMGGLNRDWRRIAETESVELSNNAFLTSQVANTPAGEKVYFIRKEMVDGHECKWCKKINGTVALWSDTALADENIHDPHAKKAIWEGKSNIGRNASDYWLAAGVQHPHCRGSWDRYIPQTETDDVDQETKDYIEQVKKRNRERIYAGEKK